MMQTTRVREALEQLRNFDADLRFMALSDLQEILGTENAQGQYEEMKDGVLELLTDRVAEVQNQAVKTLGPLLRHLSAGSIKSVVDGVLSLEAEEVRELALRSILENVIRSAEIDKYLVDSILPIVKMKYDTPTIENLAVFHTLVERFAVAFGREQVNEALELAEAFIDSSRVLVSRKAAEIIILLGKNKDRTDWGSFFEVLEAGLEFSPSRTIRRISWLTVIGGLADVLPQRKEIIEKVLHLAKPQSEDDIELSEAALAALSQLVSAGSSRSILTAIKAAAVNGVKYNPNYAEAGEDQDQGGLEDSDLEFSDASDFDADDDSWKVRRESARLGSVLFDLYPEDETLKDVVEEFLHSLAGEKNQLVKKELLRALTVSASLPGSPVYGSVKQIVNGFTDDVETLEYITLLRQMIKGRPSELAPYALVLTENSVKRIKKHKSQQIEAVLKLLSDLSVSSRAEDLTLISDALEAAAIQGLRCGQYAVEKAALKLAEKLHTQQILETVLHVVTSGQSITARAEALKVAANLGSVSENEDAVRLVATELLSAAKSDPELRIIALQSLIDMFTTRNGMPVDFAERAVADVSAMLAIQGSAIKMTVLKTLIILVKSLPSFKPAFAALVLRIEDDPETCDVKCLALACVPDEPGVAEFALSAARSIDGNSLPAVGPHLHQDLPPVNEPVSSLVALFGQIAAHRSKEENVSLIASVEAESRANAFWAKIVAEIIFESGLPVVEGDTWSDWRALITIFLAMKGVKFNLDNIFALVRSNTDVSPVISGCAIGVITSKMGSIGPVLEKFDVSPLRCSLSGIQAASTLILTGGWEGPITGAMTGLSEFLELVRPVVSSITKWDDTDVLLTGRILGAFWVLSSREKEVEKTGRMFPAWSETFAGLEAARFVFSWTADARAADEAIAFYAGARTNVVHDRNMRVIALNAVTWILQSEPGYISSRLAELLPLIFVDTTVDESRIRYIQAGPFKHKVDDGLPLRKSAYDALYALLSNAPSDFGSRERFTRDLLNHVIVGLSDDHEITVISCLLLSQLASSAVELVAERIGDIKVAFSKLLSIKVKENSVKQEHDQKAASSRAVANAARAIKEHLRQHGFADPAFGAILGYDH